VNGLIEDLLLAGLRIDLHRECSYSTAIDIKARGLMSISASQRKINVSLHTIENRLNSLEHFSVIRIPEIIGKTGRKAYSASAEF